MTEPKYAMPAEWAPHSSTWLSWPHRLKSWPGKFEPVPPVFAELAFQLSRSETVNINVLDEAMELDARRLLSLRDPEGRFSSRIVFHHIPTNDAWCRDHGPNYVFRTEDAGRQKVIIDWEYNAWGGKYKPYDYDNAVPSRVAGIQSLPLVRPDMVLEGGSIDVNGGGLLLTTEACLLNPNRNPSLSREEIEARLTKYLGVRKVLWLGDGIVGDDTDGHVDDMARFVNETTVVIAVEEDPEDENYEALQENYRRLQSFTGLDGRLLDVVKLPMPEPVCYDGERLPASYANFYIANTVVLVPTYRCARDRVAIDVLQRFFSSREVIGIDCSDLVWGLGAIHCVTHEEPAL